MLSDRVRSWLLKRLEKGLAQYEEAQQPPARLREAVVAFANECPTATRGEWIDFAARYAEECYGSGYIRGVEWVERDPEAFDGPTGLSPEDIADQYDPSWREVPWRPEIVIEGSTSAGVANVRTHDDVIAEQVARIMAKPRRI